MGVSARARVPADSLTTHHHRSFPSYHAKGSPRREDMTPTTSGFARRGHCRCRGGVEAPHNQASREGMSAPSTSGGAVPVGQKVDSELVGPTLWRRPRRREGDVFSSYPAAPQRTRSPPAEASRARVSMGDGNVFEAELLAGSANRERAGPRGAGVCGGDASDLADLPKERVQSTDPELRCGLRQIS